MHLCFSKCNLTSVSQMSMFCKDGWHNTSTKMVGVYLGHQSLPIELSNWMNFAYFIRVNTSEKSQFEIFSCWMIVPIFALFAPSTISTILPSLKNKKVGKLSIVLGIFWVSICKHLAIKFQLIEESTFELWRTWVHWWSHRKGNILLLFYGHQLEIIMCWLFNANIKTVQYHKLVNYKWNFSIFSISKARNCWVIKKSSLFCAIINFLTFRLGDPCQLGDAIN